MKNKISFGQRPEEIFLCNFKALKLPIAKLI